MQVFGRYIQLYLILFFIFLTGNLQAVPKYYFKQISLEEGLSQSSVKCVLVDERGVLWIEIPYFMGYNNPNTNAGKMSTHGYDIEIGWNDQIGEFKYGVNVNFSDFLSKIDYMNDGEQISSGKIKRAGVLSPSRKETKANSLKL